MVADTEREGSGTARLRITPAGSTIDVDGVIDICNTTYLEMLLRRARALGGPIQLDLTNVPFVTAAGLTVLASWAQSVTLLNPTQLILRELEITDLRDQVHIAA